MSYRVFAIQSTAPIFNAQVQTFKVMKELRHWRTLTQDAGYPGYACFAQPQFACFVSLAWSRLNAKSTMGVNQLKASPDGSMFDVNLRHLNLHWKYSNTKIAMNKKDCSKLCLKRETNCQERTNSAFRYFKVVRDAKHRRDTNKRTTQRIWGVRTNQPTMPMCSWQNKIQAPNSHLMLELHASGEGSRVLRVLA